MKRLFIMILALALVIPLLGASSPDILSQINAERAAAGVQELQRVAVLDTLADIRAAEAATSWSHTRPDGRQWFSVYRDFGFLPTAAGENLAYGFTTPERVVTAWMNSPTHKANIVDPDFKYIGIGSYDNDGKVYWAIELYQP